MIVGASVVYFKHFPMPPVQNSPLLNEAPSLPASHPAAAFKFPPIGCRGRKP